MLRGKELLQLSGLQMAELIRNGVVSSVDCVKTHIEHIEAVNGKINAVVGKRYDEALSEAKAADRAVKAKKKLGSYHGVPFTVKECFAVDGMPNTAGTVYRKDVKASEDSTTVTRMKKAGGIVVGVTNTSEICLWVETNNRVYGMTNNPYNTKRTVGGSSGGEGAIIGAGGSPLGVASDLAGSIRLPAFFNGIFGHKPTGGLVPNTGHFPPVASGIGRCLVTGPMARKSEDLWPMLKIMAGPDERDSCCETFKLVNPNKVKISDLKVFNIHGDGSIKVSDDLLGVQNKVARHLSLLGASVEEHQVFEFKKSLDIWSSFMAAAKGEPTIKMLGGGVAIKPFKEFFKWMFRMSHHTLPAIVLPLLESISAFSEKRVENHVKLGKNLKEKLMRMLGPDGIILFPSYSVPAPSHYEPLWRTFHWAFMAIFNTLEFPVTQVPLGLNPQGLPLGVQVVSSPGNDHITIAVAQELERRFGGWVMPAL
ncbi:amidase [bacterium]|nr:amidase [bacterium]